MWCFLQVLKRGEGGCFYKQAVFNRGFKDSMCSLITILCETYRQTILLSDQRWGREVQGGVFMHMDGRYVQAYMVILGAVHILRNLLIWIYDFVFC